MPSPAENHLEPELNSNARISNWQQGGSLLLVEDEDVLRGLLIEHIAAKHPEIAVIEAGDGVAAWNLFQQEAPQFCIVDLRLPGMDGLSLIQLMLASLRPPRILILTAQPDWKHPAALDGREGIFFLDKTAPLADLSRALKGLISKDAIEGKRFRLTGGVGKQAKTHQLTKREQLVLAMIGGGLSIRSISEILGISPHTTLTHRKNILRKLELNSSVQLVRFALESGITVSRTQQQ